MTYKYAPYSYSKIGCFLECPFKFKLKYIDKVKRDSDSYVFEKGHFFHGVLEHYPKPFKFEFKFDENRFKLNEFIEQLKEIIMHNKEIRALLTTYKLKSEYEYFLDADFKHVKTKDDALIWGKIDYLGQIVPGELLIVDWKTGKSKASFEQLKFYALWAFTVFKNINKIKGILYFIEQDRKEEIEISRDDYEELKSQYLTKINTIEETLEFKKQTNSRCEWCSYYNDCKPYNYTRRKT